VLGPVSPQVKGIPGRRLPPRRAPRKQQDTTAADAEAGPSCVVITGTPQVVTGNEELLVLPPMPREIFEELTTMFDHPDSSLTDPDTSDDESKRRKFGWPDQ
jgi:hypothetical protein